MNIVTPWVNPNLFSNMDPFGHSTDVAKNTAAPPSRPGKGGALRCNGVAAFATPWVVA